MKKDDVITDTKSEMPKPIVCSIKLSFDEMYLFVEPCLENKIMVFDVATLQYLETTALEDSESGQIGKALKDKISISDIEFMNDNFIISSSDKCYKIWNTKSGKYVSSLDSPPLEQCDEYFIFQFVISVDEKYVFVRGGIQTEDCRADFIDIYDLKTGKLITELDDGFKFKQDLISLSGNRLIILYSNYVIFWDVENRECIEIITLSNRDKEGYSSITVTKDEKYLISWYYVDESNISYIKFWDISSGQCVKVLSTFGDCILSVVVPSDYKFIFSLQPNCIKKWDTETCEVTDEINFPLIK